MRVNINLTINHTADWVYVHYYPSAVSTKAVSGLFCHSASSNKNYSKICQTGFISLFWFDLMLYAPINNFHSYEDVSCVQGIHVNRVLRDSRHLQHLLMYFGYFK